MSNIFLLNLFGNSLPLIEKEKPCIEITDSNTHQRPRSSISHKQTEVTAVSGEVIGQPAQCNYLPTLPLHTQSACTGLFQRLTRL